MTETKKATIPNPSVGADGEQSQIAKSTSMIQTSDGNVNLSEEILLDFDQIDIMMKEMSDPAYLPTVTLNQLYDQSFQGKPPIIVGLLYPGTYLFAGAPKVGKSFLMAQLAYHVSTGQKLWNYDVHQGTVLYLALEDD